MTSDRRQVKACSCLSLVTYYYSCRVADDDCARGNVFGDNRARSDRCSFAYLDAGKNSCASSDACSAPHGRQFNSPISIRLQCAVVGSGTRVLIVDEVNAVAYENFILNRYAFANKCVAGYFAVAPDTCALLYLDEGAYLCAVANFTAVEIDEMKDGYITTELYVRAYQAELASHEADPLASALTVAS